MSRRVFINGRAGDAINVNDRGLQYGDGLFETIAIVHGKLRRLVLHLDRLETGCARLGIRCPPRELLISELTSFAGYESHAVLKLILTRGVSDRGYRPREGVEPTRIVSLHDWPNHPAHWRETGVAVRWCTATLAEQPLLAGIKHLNRLEQVLARREWSDPDIAEGLLCDTHGHVIGGTMTNIFLVHDNELSTPRLDSCGVAGTVRAAVLSLANEIGMHPFEKELTPNDVASAHEVFLTNALVGIWPVNRIDGRDVPAGPLACRFQDLLNC